MNSYFRGKYLGTNRMRDTVHQQQEAALRQAAPSQREPLDSSRCSENQFSVCFLKIPSLTGWGEKARMKWWKGALTEAEGWVLLLPGARHWFNSSALQASVYAFVRRRDHSRPASLAELRPE